MYSLPFTLHSGRTKPCILFCEDESGVGPGDERNHIEKPLFDQLAGLGWKLLDLEGVIEASSKIMEA
jgi:hypothetical protein